MMPSQKNNQNNQYRGRTAVNEGQETALAPCTCVSLFNYCYNIKQLAPMQQPPAAVQPPTPIAANTSRIEDVKKKWGQYFSYAPASSAQVLRWLQGIDVLDQGGSCSFRALTSAEQEQISEALFPPLYDTPQKRRCHGRSPDGSRCWQEPAGALMCNGVYFCVHHIKNDSISVHTMS